MSSSRVSQVYEDIGEISQEIENLSHELEISDDFNNQKPISDISDAEYSEIEASFQISDILSDSYDETSLYDRSILALRKRNDKIHFSHDSLEPEDLLIPRKKKIKLNKPYVPIQERIDEAMKKKEERLQRQLHMNMEKEVEECTFKPKHYSSAQWTPRSEHKLKTKSAPATPKHAMNPKSVEIVQKSDKTADFYSRQLKKTKIEKSESPSPSLKPKKVIEDAVVRLSTPKAAKNIEIRDDSQKTRRKHDKEAIIRLTTIKKTEIEEEIPAKSPTSSKYADQLFNDSIEAYRMKEVLQKQRKQYREEVELAECTFHPKLNRYYPILERPTEQIPQQTSKSTPIKPKRKSIISDSEISSVLDEVDSMMNKM